MALIVEKGVGVYMVPTPFLFVPSAYYSIAMLYSVGKGDFLLLGVRVTGR
jgi:hypothetical protein